MGQYINLIGSRSGLFWGRSHHRSEIEGLSTLLCGFTWLGMEAAKGSREFGKIERRFKESAMNWNQIEGQWHQLAGQIKSQWAKVTDNDLKNVAGKREQFIGKLQERYGVVKDEAEKQVEKWIAQLTPVHDDKPS
jgi:uncharacterized protein YjbJ (UPF0337 family)